MVYIESWDSFLEQSVQIFKDNPENTRYVMKYRHCDGKLVLKVTDNSKNKKERSSQSSRELFMVTGKPAVQLEPEWLSKRTGIVIAFANDQLFPTCLKFKTDQAQDAKKMEKLNNIFFTLMTKGPDADLTEETDKEQPAPKKGRGRRQ